MQSTRKCYPVQGWFVRNLGWDRNPGIPGKCRRDLGSMSWYSAQRSRHMYVHTWPMYIMRRNMLKRASLFILALRQKMLTILLIHICIDCCNVLESYGYIYIIYIYIYIGWWNGLASILHILTDVMNGIDHTYVVIDVMVWRRSSYKFMYSRRQTFVLTTLWS